MTSSSRKPRTSARPTKYVKLNSRQMHSIMKKHEQKVSIREIAKQVSKAWGVDVPRSTIHSIITKHNVDGATTQGLNVKLRGAVGQAIRTLIRPCKKKRHSRWVVEVGEVKDYITAHRERLGLTEKQLPGLTKLRQLVNSVCKKKRTRTDRKTPRADVKQIEISEDELATMNRFVNRGYL